MTDGDSCDGAAFTPHLHLKQSSLEGADECRCHCRDWNIYLGTEGDSKSKDRIYFEVVMKYIRARNIVFGASGAITLADADARH